MNKTIHHHSRRLIFTIFSGADDSFLKLDLSFLNLRILNTNSKEFMGIIESMIPPDHGKDFIKHEQDRYIKWNLDYSNLHHSPTHAVIPIDFSNPVKSEVFHQLQYFLLLMFPSNLRIYSEVTYNRYEETSDKYSRTGHSEWKAYISISVKKNTLRIAESEIENVSKFLQLCFDRLPKLRWLSVAFDSYQGSFFHWSKEMVYLSLCISLESLSSSKTEITHQLSRMCAVLNSETKEQGAIVYTNMKRFYNLRSEIVHGSNYDNELVNKYFFPLYYMVSRTIIELVYLNIDSKEKLTDLINEQGYGTRKEFSPESGKYNFNSESIVKLFEVVPKK